MPGLTIAPLAVHLQHNRAISADDHFLRLEPGVGAPGMPSGMVPSQNRDRTRMVAFTSETRLNSGTLPPETFLMSASKRSVVLSLAALLYALSAFPQSDAVSIDHQPSEVTFRAVREQQVFTVPTLARSEYAATPTPRDGSSSASEGLPQPDRFPGESPATLTNSSGEDSNNSASIAISQPAKPPAFNRDIYYRNKLEFSLDVGWHPINIPFPLDIFVGDVYNTYPLKYTLVPIFASLRWHIDGIEGPWILRGNWDLTSTASITAIPRGPENRYFAYLMGIRRNFVPRRGKIAPYFDVRLGVGNIDAKGPSGVLYAQGQDVTFTVNMGSGARYNFNPRYAISAGLNFMHISNLDLSESNGKPNWGVRNYGINVYGPMVGLDIQLRRHRSRSEQ